MVFEHPNAGTENRRADVRLQFTRPNKAWIRIVSASGRSVISNPGPIDLRDISPGGCGFRCALRFPATPLFLLEVEMRIGGKPMEVLGQIRWQQPIENEYAYGMKFLLSRGERLQVKQILNELVLTVCPGQAKIHRLYRAANNR